ncbi:MAG: tRNA uridine-5-carboxymethylaminomethyl(34) synthesis GTPase MnmE [Gemmatimonadaceae bacterium]|nr:tRNA uridine-5-carboxymethylaminomethyl(34) synthesis GTPase MnmE [Gemmatimonadaceae bacterium]
MTHGQLADVVAIGANDTIAAIATTPGRGALAMVRLSGPDVRTLAARLLDPAPRELRHATRCIVRGETGESIDEIVATLFVAPHSFTGEDMLEMSTHGGLVAPVAVLAAAIQAGAREALPGEFTRRAVLHGKLDVLQAEAIGDLIDARSGAAHRAALRQLDGGLTRRAVALREQVVAVEALLAYDIDFPEEDDGPITPTRITEAAAAALADVRTLLATGAAGTLVHEGALIVLAGPPNAGKSSLFNALLGEARAIVTETPGTTRDAIEAVLDRDGWPLRLVDTAGLRLSDEPVERLGIEVSARYLARATVVLGCVDDDRSIEIVRALIEAHTKAPILIVRTKGDLAACSDEPAEGILVSAVSGRGVGRLLERIDAMVRATAGEVVPDAPGLTRARHRAAVTSAVHELEQFLDAWRSGAIPAVASATHVRAAGAALGELIGAVRTDDVLNAVFRTFCVGK